MKNFWLIEKSPKLIFEEFIKPENPEATLWDVFTDYSLIFPSIEPADTSQEWQAEQKKLISDILKEQFSNKTLNRNKIEDLICAIQEFGFPQEEQVLDYLNPNSLEFAKQIYDQYIKPRALSDATIQLFLDELEDALQQRNKKHIVKVDKDNIRKMMRDMPHYSDEKSEEIVKHLEHMWELSKNEETEEEYEDFQEKNVSRDFIWPELGLAYSQSFYGFGDGGNLSYEEQETQAELKYNQFKDEVSELLRQQPDVNLQPQQIEFTDAMSDAYFMFEEENHFVHEFENEFTVWNGKERVLFLSLRKEDKELPYEIILGGMVMSSYKQFLKAYNQL